MNQILNQLQTINLTDVKLKPFKALPYNENEAEAIERINSAAEQYLDTRPIQLASIMRALQVALQDKEFGSFETGDAVSLAYFMESELETLGQVIGIKDETDFHLEAIKKGNSNGS